MRNFIQFISRIFHHKVSAENGKIKNMDHETGVKLLQYFMLCVLLTLCFILPGEGVKKGAKESAQQYVRQELQGNDSNGNPGMQGSSGQNAGISTEKLAGLGSAAGGEENSDSGSAAGGEENSSSGSATGKEEIPAGRVFDS